MGSIAKTVISKALRPSDSGRHISLEREHQKSDGQCGQPVEQNRPRQGGTTELAGSGVSDGHYGLMGSKTWGGGDRIRGRVRRTHQTGVAEGFNITPAAVVKLL